MLDVALPSDGGMMVWQRLVSGGRDLFHEYTIGVVLAAFVLVANHGHFRLPILVVHGEDDKIAPISGSQRFVDAANSEEITLYAVPAALHEPFNAPGGETLIDEVGIWIRERARR